MTKQPTTDVDIALNKKNVKKFAQRLKRSLAQKNIQLKLNECYELLAHTVGVSNWHELSQLLDKPSQNSSTLGESKETDSAPEIVNILNQKIDDSLLDKQTRLLNQATKLMNNVEYWTYDDEKLLKTFNEIFNYALKNIKSQQMIKLKESWLDILDNLPTNICMSFMHTIDNYYPALSFYFILDEVQNKKASLLADRMLIIARLNLLTSVVAPTRSRLIKVLLLDETNTHLLRIEEEKESNKISRALNQINKMKIISDYPSLNIQPKEISMSELYQKMQTLSLKLKTLFEEEQMNKSEK